MIKKRYDSHTESPESLRRLIIFGSTAQRRNNHTGFRNMTSNGTVEQNIAPTNVRCSGADLFITDAQQIASILKNLPFCFSATLEEHMIRLNITIEQLSELSGLSVSTVKRYRYRSDESFTRSLKTVVLICIAMKLHPLFSFDLIRKAGFCFNYSLEHTAYQVLLINSQTYGIDMCNDYLTSIGLTPLI